MERNLLFREISSGHLPFGRPQLMTSAPGHLSESEIALGIPQYLEVKLERNLPANTGVFIPEGFKPTPAGVDLVIYFHGDLISACQTNSAQFAKRGIEYYWQTDKFRCLWEEFGAESQNAILLAPNLGTVPSRPGQYDDLAQPHRFDVFVNDCLKQLVGSGFLPSTTQPRFIILAGHSGGGLPLQTILGAKNDLGSKIIECWGFDSQYFGRGVLGRWLQANPDKTYYHFGSLTQAGHPSRPWKSADVLRNDHPNAYSIPVAKGENTKHCDVVRRWWGARLRDCNWLRGDQETGGIMSTAVHGLASVAGNFVQLPTAVFAALMQGVTDESVLTNLIFNYRHPELRGQKLRKNDPQKLKTEWGAIRRDIVQPLLARLAAGQNPASGNSSSLPATAISSPSGSGNYKLFTCELSKVPFTFIIQKGPDKGKKINKSPHEFIREILRNAGFDPDKWLSSYTRITFLGRELNEGEFVHVETAKRLQQAEQYFLQQYGSEAEAVRQLGLTEESLAGSRPVSPTATFSMHMFGLAVDVNYLGNPFVRDESIPTLNAVLERAARLLNEQQQQYRQGLAYEKIVLVDQQLERYFKLLDEDKTLQSLLANQPREPWKGLGLSKAREKIRSDLNQLAKKLSRGGKLIKYVRYGGILNHTKAFIDGMKAHGFHWGGDYGDMMHFDLRDSPGIGQKIQVARLAYAEMYKKK